MTFQGIAVVTVGLALHAGFAEALELEEIFKRPDQRAVEMLENGEFEAAADTFKDQQWRGISRYRAGLYEEAMKDFAAAEDAEGLYNHGVAAARAGDYDQSVSSLEKALELAPEDTNIAHNLNIARELKDLAEQQQQENDQGDQQQESGDEQQSEQDESSQEGSESEQSESSDQQDDSQQGEQNEQAESESPQSGEQESNASQQSNGEMSADQNDQSSPEQEQSAEDLREMMQQEQQQAESEQQPEQQQEQQMAASATESVSEDDQATEQWLRRIPDDASQLLRNKIRLNHMIEFPEVRDMQEPW